jgi:hypothetical protein
MTQRQALQCVSCGFHDSDDNDDVLLAFGAVWTSRYMAALKMNTVSFSETLESTDESTRSKNTE